MALVGDLCGVGVAPEAAKRLGLTKGSAVGAGTTNADAFQLLKDATFLSCTGAASSGFKLPADAELGVPYVLSNVTANAMLIYPGTGNSINGDTATTGTVPLNTRGTTICIRYSATEWMAIIGAAG